MKELLFSVFGWLVGWLSGFSLLKHLAVDMRILKVTFVYFQTALLACMRSGFWQEINQATKPAAYVPFFLSP